MRRLFEILPGAAAWATLLGLLALSWLSPSFVVVFIVLYDLFWFLRTCYLLLHLQLSFIQMRRNLARDWPARLAADCPGWQRVHHLIVLPIYREPASLLEETLKSLAASRYPLDRFTVVLATEERGGEEDRSIARVLTGAFGKRFGKLMVTVHPADIPGELPGKGANETWAVRRAVAEHLDPSGIAHRDVLVSVFDSDTRPGRDYFGVLTRAFLTATHPYRSSYQPIPLFINNMHRVPLFSRLVAFTASMWQFMQQSRPEQLVTFSSHSMPLSSLIEVGYWQTDIVSEDSRIFFQCLSHYGGDWRVVPLHYPVYMDAVGGATYGHGLRNLYRQQRRWAWGVENIPYALGVFSRNCRMPLRQRLFWCYTLFDGFHSWATNSFIIFLFGFLPNLMGGAAFRTTVLSYNLSHLTGFLINLSTVGIVTIAFTSTVLILPTLKREGAKRSAYLLYAAQWFLLPLTLIAFSGLPALDAQTRLMLGGRFRLGFWRTPKESHESRSRR